LFEFALMRRRKEANSALGTMARGDKGPVIPPPSVEEPLGTVVRAISGWDGVTTTGHWDPFHPAIVDGIDFYFGPEELGHIHLDGSLHLASSPELGRYLVSGGLAEAFPYVHGWVQAAVADIGADAAIALFRCNYDRLAREAASTDAFGPADSTVRCNTL
jgi:hypothetical protein